MKKKQKTKNIFSFTVSLWGVGVRILRISATKVFFLLTPSLSKYIDMIELCISISIAIYVYELNTYQWIKTYTYIYMYIYIYTRNIKKLKKIDA